MKLFERLNQMLRTPKLTRGRIIFALGVALAADGLQLGLNAFGWFGADQMIDLVAMILTMRLLGFHILLLPTFVAELIPLLDDLPTWTACVIAVIALRKREQHFTPPTQISPPPLPPKSTDRPAIDV